jgi:gamma-glutamyltranspeptidase/glutathione hydrolase
MALPVHLTQHWAVSKPSVATRCGIVAAQQRAAAETGAAILAEGGNAVDAAVATAFALAALEPWNSGLGGVGFMVVHPAGVPRAEIVDFGPVAPHALDPAAYPLAGGTRTELFSWPRVEGDRNIDGPLSFAIPSAVAGLALAVERFGRLPWRELVTPAAALAREGLPVDWWTTLKVANAASGLRRWEASRGIWLPDGLPPVCPPDRDTLRLPLGRLSDTLERLAVVGAHDFYRGEIAAAIDRDLRAADAFLSADDLAGCRARIVPPLEVPYRTALFQAAPGMTAGPTLARVLARLGRERFAAAPDAGYFATLGGILRDAYAERLEREGDAETAAGTSTTHVTAVDRDGGIAALTTTLLSSFGSRYVLPGTGILLNNGIVWFDPRPGRPNSIAPGKRALTNMCPVVAARDGRPWLGIGASGGRRILAAVLQLANFITDFGMTPQEAAHAPRIDVSGPDRLDIDRRLDPAIIARLLCEPGAALAEHTALPARFACPNLVLRGEDGVNRGITDAMSPWSAAIAEREPG